MQDSPNLVELVGAVESFLRDRAMPELEGHTQFHARVAANVLAIIARELELGPEANKAEHARLEKLLGEEGSLEDLNARLCQAIRAGDITLATEGLKEHLLQTTMIKVEIDQPKYSGLRVAKARWGHS